MNETGGEPGDALGRAVADYRALIAALSAHGVRFLVAGGVAVIFQGYVRFTQDLDVIPSPEAKNMKRLADALRDLEAVAAAPHGKRMPLDLSHPESLAVGNYFLETKLGGLDLLNGQRPDLKRYRRLEEGALEVEIGKDIVKVLGKDDLIAMKREAGRPKDLRDIAALTEVERNPAPGG